MRRATITTAAILALAALPPAGRAEIVDRVMAVVGRDVITWSDLDREARLEAYFNGRPAPAATQGVSSNQKPGEYREVLERLIEQRLAWREMDQSKVPLPDDGQVQKRLEQLQAGLKGAPGGVRPADYGLREQDLLDYARRAERIDRFLKTRLQDREIDSWLKELRARARVRVIEDQ